MHQVTPITLICFPHAGALTDPYRDLAKRLAPQVNLITVVPANEVCEGLSADAFIERILCEKAALFAQNYALWGHSAGGLLALKLAQKRAKVAPPQHVFVASSTAPEAFPNRVPKSTVPDAELVAFMKKLGGTNKAIFLHPEALELCLQSLRRDLRLMESHAPFHDGQIAAPVTEIWGEDEPLARNAPYWAQASSLEHQHIRFPGGHFHPQENQGLLANLILTKLRCLPVGVALNNNNVGAKNEI